MSCRHPFLLCSSYRAEPGQGFYPPSHLKKIQIHMAELHTICREGHLDAHMETTWGEHSTVSGDQRLLRSTCRCPFVYNKGRSTRRKGAQRPFETPPVATDRNFKDQIHRIPLEPPVTVASRRHDTRRHADPFLKNPSNSKGMLFSVHWPS